MTDKDLVDQAQRGDRLAADKLARKYMPLLMVYFKRRIRSEDAMDMVQRTLELTLGRLDGFRSECSLKNYIFVVAGRLYYEHLRTRDRRPKAVSIYDCSEPPSEVADPYAQLELERSVYEAEAAIADLPSPFGQAVVLHLLGLSSTEVGDTMGVGSNTARSRISRGLARVRGVAKINSRFSDAK